MPSKPSKAQRISPWVVFPTLGWFFWFLFVPLCIVAVYSFSTRGPYGGIVFRFNSENYLRAAQLVYLRIFWNSFELASVTAFICLLVGFPMAYVMAISSVRVRSLLLIFVVIPFWTNFVVRAYAVKVLLSDFGPIQRLIYSLGFHHEIFSISNGQFAVLLGMVTNYLPFMVLPLYVSLEKFDFSLIEAAKDLGASSSRILFNILIPLTKTGIVTGLILVFTPALGEFVIPDLLGGARTMLIGNLITDQFLKARDWPFGASLSLLLIIVVLLSLVIYLRVESEKGS